MFQKTMVTAMSAALLQLASFGAQAAPALTSFDAPAVFFGQDHSLGYSFTANQNLAVTSLGYYDSNRDGLATTHFVGIYDANQTLLGSAAVGGSSVLNGDFRYSALVLDQSPYRADVFHCRYNDRGCRWLGVSGKQYCN